MGWDVPFADPWDGRGPPAIFDAPAPKPDLFAQADTFARGVLGPAYGPINAAAQLFNPMVDFRLMQQGGREMMDGKPIQGMANAATGFLSMFGPGDEAMDMLKLGALGAMGAKRSAMEAATAVPTRGYHATYEPFDEFDWSRLGETTLPNVSGTSVEDYALNLARIGPWAADASVASKMAAPVTLPVDISGTPKAYNSLKSLERAVRSAGGPEKFREALVKQGYGHIKVADEEFGVKSFIGLSPENFRVTKEP